MHRQQEFNFSESKSALQLVFFLSFCIYCISQACFTPPGVCELVRCLVWIFNWNIAQSKGIIKQCLKERVNVKRECWKGHIASCANSPPGNTNLFLVQVMMDATLSLFISSHPYDPFVSAVTKFTSKSCFPSETIGLLRKGLVIDLTLFHTQYLM